MTHTPYSWPSGVAVISRLGSGASPTQQAQRKKQRALSMAKRMVRRPPPAGRLRRGDRGLDPGICRYILGEGQVQRQVPQKSKHSRQLCWGVVAVLDSHRRCHFLPGLTQPVIFLMGRKSCRGGFVPRCECFLHYLTASLEGAQAPTPHLQPTWPGVATLPPQGGCGSGGPGRDSPPS